MNYIFGRLTKVAEGEPPVVHVETVDLSVRNVRLPPDRVGMVIAQPNTTLTVAEPYQCTAASKPQQLAMVAETLAVSRAVRHGAPKTHFTVFPEYSLPGLEGVQLIDDALRADDWPAGTIVIGGTDALSETHYRELLQCDATHVDVARNGIDNVGHGRWVNCAITWVKGADGTVERWIQPKLHPAWPEMNISHQHMFCGTSVYMFKGRLENDVPFRFCTLVCFDWIAMIGARTPLQWILSDLHQQADGNQLPLSWLFIIQHNPKPSHHTFLTGVGTFFNQTEFPNALRDRACLVFANSAGKAAPGRTSEFGGSSVVLSPQSLFTQPDCAPTFSSGGPQFRDGSNLLATFKDVVFRERGACIHSFAQVNPGSLVAGAAGRSFAVEDATVSPVSGVLEPRAPAAEVPAPIKWLNDELDDLPQLSLVHHAAPLGAQVDAAHVTNTAALRRVSSQFTSHAIALAAQESSAEHADRWSSTESAALRHLLHTLDIIGVAFAPPTVGGTTAHATFPIDTQLIDLVAVRGASHEACIEHSKTVLPNPQRQLLLVSRDHDNTRWQRRFGSFLQPAAPQPGAERRITDPSSGTMHLGYQNLLEVFLRSATPEALLGGVNAELVA